MGNRLSKITTRTGDDGSTGLGDGSRVPKNHVRIEAMGDIDELNSAIGVVLAEPISDEIRQLLASVQHELFDLGGEICIPGREALDESHLTHLEDVMAKLTNELPPLKEFILPGGCRAAALLHVARATCRRAERRLVALDTAETISATSRKYLNRLSDLLFQLSRIANRNAGVSDVYWLHNRNARQ